jgi:ribosome-associated protein
MAKAALEVKADEVVILDLRGISYNFDYFFLCSASSDRRMQTIGDRIQEVLQMAGHPPRHWEGRPESGWLLLDCGSVVGHIFSPEMRRFYQLERLWADAPQVRLPKVGRIQEETSGD